MMWRNAVGLTALLLTVAACAGGARPPQSVPTVESVAAGRGRSIAEVRCAGCHSIAVGGDSPRAGAPSFGQVRLRYNALSWPRVMREIGEGLHGEMPPTRVTEAEADDLRVYIETLR